MRTSLFFIFFIIIFNFSCGVNAPRRAEVLFYGSGIDQVSTYATWMGVEIFKTGINLTYTDEVDQLNDEYLKKFDAVILFADVDEIPVENDKALHKFFKSGKGILSFNVTANSFKNSTWLNKLSPEGYSVMENRESNIELTEQDLIPIEDIEDFIVTNESYQLQSVPESIRVIAKNKTDNQPYMWAKKEGKGRFFYSVLGAKQEVWKDASFLRTIHRATWWGIGEEVRKLVNKLNIPNVSIYEDAISDFTARHDVPRVQEALKPEESMKLIQKPVDFELKLFASEPDIVNPIAMNWDEKGRLWVVETVDYPNSFKEMNGQANDRIKICEDTDGDGIADKFTVFAEGLNIATSLTFANDGVIVAMAPYFIFMKDTDGDGVADVRDTIMMGWNKNDTHAGPSNLQYGFDNKIYGVTGYAGFDGEINGERQQFSQGLYRFNTDGSDFEFLATTNNNTWGLGISEDNNIFISTANNTHSAFYSMPERLLQRKLKQNRKGMGVHAVQKIDGHYEVHALTPNLRQVDVVGGFTSAAGHQMYTARDYPKSYWNRSAFITEPTVRLIHNAIIEPDGAGFKEKDGWNFLSSSDEWFGPIHAEVGPDGAVWVLDWYNFIIQHNVFVPAQAPSEKVLPFTEQPHGAGNAFESELRDKKHGRVYRVVFKDAKHDEKYKLSKSDPKGLVKALKSTNKFWRTHAQRLLVESKATKVKDELVALIKDSSVDEIGLNAPAIHAIWALDGLGLVASDNLVRKTIINALKHPSAGVRKAAVQVLHVENDIQDLVKSAVFEDENLNTRLAAFVKLAEAQPSDNLGELLANLYKDEVNHSDKWLSAALFAASQTHQRAVEKLAATEKPNQYYSDVLESLNEEKYHLGRRAKLQFSPDVSHKNILVETKVERKDNNKYNGLVIGHGTATDGYALFFRDNKLYWEIYQSGVSYSISTTAGVNNSFHVNAVLDAKKGMELYVNGSLVGHNKAVSVFERPLSVYLRSGGDIDGKTALTTYENGSEFTGNIGGVDVSLSLARINEDTIDSMSLGKESKDLVTEQGETILVKAVKDIMQYDKKEIIIKAGVDVTLIFENPDGMPHNLLIISPGSLETVGKAADDMLRNPDAAEKQYVPNIKEVLHHTSLVNSGESAVLKFTLDTAGEYPFVCTFPGHWRGMHGVIKVVK